MRRIAAILPKGEGFSPRHFGAIALCVRDFTRHSRYREGITILGGMEGGFDFVRYRAMPRPRWFEDRTRAYARACARILHEDRIDLAEIHNRPILLRLIARKTQCRLALHLHNDPQAMRHARTAGQRNALLAQADAIYCVSAYVRERFLEGLPPQAAPRVRVIHNGVEIPPELPPKEKLIVFAGRLTEDKGARLFAEALLLALPRLPGWRGILIGASRHDPDAPGSAYEKTIASYLSPLGARALLTGFLGHEETLSWFARAHIAAVPSLWPEPFGLTALEAMAAGCALISSGRGALREVTGEAALTLPSLDPGTLAESLCRLAENESERARLQILARERAKAFAINTQAAALDAARDEIFSRVRSHVA